MRITTARPTRIATATSAYFIVRGVGGRRKRSPAAPERNTLLAALAPRSVARDDMRNSQTPIMSIRQIAFALAVPVFVAGQGLAPTSGVRPTRLIVRNATVVDGNGTPAKGPFDIVVVGN